MFGLFRVALFNGLKNDGVELADGFCIDVEVLHHHFTRTPADSPDNAQRFSQRFLNFENQSVFVAVGEQMHMNPQPIKAFGDRFQKFAFSAGDQAFFKDFLPSVAEMSRPEHPDQNIQISKTARGFFNVRLQSIRGLVVLQMPLLLFDEFCPIKLFKIQILFHRFRIGLKKLFISGDEARLKHRRLSSNVDFGLFKAFFDASHRVTDGQTERP